MHVTELLVTGINDRKTLFAVTLAPGTATTVLTKANDDNVVDLAWEQTSNAFTDIQDLIQGLTIVPPQEAQV